MNRTLGLPSELPLVSEVANVPAEQRGRERLKGAYLIPLDRIRPDPSQPRRFMAEDSLDELAASIVRLGVVQAISVRYVVGDDIYQIVSGERRFRASKLAKLSAIPAIICEPAEREILTRQIVENWQRAQLHPFEIADALARLRDTNNLSQKQLAEETGKSEAEVSKLLKLLNLAPEVQKAARADPSGALSFNHLYPIARLDPKDQQAVAIAAREQRLTANATEKLVQQTIRRRTSMPPRGAPSTRVQYVTSKATVLFTFRKQSIAAEDILAALDEVRAKATGTGHELNIIRPK